MKRIGITIGLFVLLIVLLVVLVWRCWHLQYSRGDYFAAVSTKQQEGFIGLKPQRGVILDCRGRVLAASNEVQTIFAEPRLLEDPKETASALAPILDMGAHIICRLITEGRNPGFTRLVAGADTNQCIAADKVYGVGVQSDWQRHYPMGGLAAHVVGFTGLDNLGLEGIELQYQKELNGSAGRNVFLADAFRRPVRLKQISGVSDGIGIILTIDATIQQFTRVELSKQVEGYQAESGVAIVAEPKTGAILAMVSLPDFDPCNLNSADPNDLRNRAITDQYEPGSLIKPIIVAIALDDGSVNRTEKIFCENGSYSGKGFGRIGEYRNGFGDLTVREILVHSSNIGMAKIGQRMGKGKLYKGLTLFGFGSQTGIDLPGEAPGLLWPPEKWTGYSVTRIPFGQEISVTAMQLVRGFCILANGGHPVRPHLVRAMVDNNGDIIPRSYFETAKQSDIGYVVSPEVAKWVVTDPMVGVINEGTGTRAKLKKWTVFGKTGTANIAKPDERGYSERDYVASFVVGAPADDPAVIILVSIRRPNVSLGKGYTGGAVASPVAAAILEKTLTYLEKHPL
jgi:cell division protein FtsI (penicillin-binding protein 3)